MKRPREAEYTVEVPIVVKFKALSDLSGEELLIEAKKQFNKAFRKKKYKLLPKRLEITDKKYVYTKEEQEAEQRFWSQVFGGVFNG